MAPFPWRIDERNRFLIRAEVHGERTAYTAYVYRNDSRDWWKLATFRTRTTGSPLRGYYSFVEDFRRDYRSVNDLRRARFGNGWVRSAQGDWTPLDRARFTASGADWESKDNIDAGIGKNGWYYLATGGNASKSRDLKSIIRRPESPNRIAPPTDLPSEIGSRSGSINGPRAKRAGAPIWHGHGTPGIGSSVRNSSIHRCFWSTTDSTETARCTGKPIIPTIRE